MSIEREPLRPGVFFGDLGPPMAASGVRVSISAYPAGERLPLHGHASPYLSVVLGGWYVEDVGPHVLECLPLGLRLHGAGEEHADAFGDAGGRCLNVELDESWQESVEPFARAAGRPLLVESAGPLAWRAAAEYRRPGGGSALVLESIAADLLGLCERRARIDRAAERSPAVRRALAMVEDCLGRPLALAEVAAAAGLHPTHFARSFRALTGCTVGDYVRRRRVARAQALLRARRAATVSRVAAEAGFADHAHLTRTFKRATGVAPNEYRRALRGG